MINRLLKATALGGALAATLAAPLATTAQAHHSFAIYTDALTFSFVGVINSMIPEANHAILTFLVVNETRDGFVCRQAEDANGNLGPVMRADGSGCEYVVWSMEITGAAGAANAGISLVTFPQGTVFSAALNPERASVPDNVGVLGGDATGGALFKGGGGGDGVGNVGRVSVCPRNADTGRYVIPPPGQFCNSLEGANTAIGGSEMGAMPEGAIEWASWAFAPTTVGGDVVIQAPDAN